MVERRKYISHAEAERIKALALFPMPEIEPGRQEIGFVGVYMTDIYVVDDDDPRLGTVETVDDGA